MKLLVDVTKGWSHIDGIKDDLISQPNGEMTHFPLCCSTGVLKNLGAQSVTNSNKAGIQKPEGVRFLDPDKIKEAHYMHEITREANKQTPPVLYPYKVGRWMAMSLIWAKTKEGHDDGGRGGYTRFKTAQITMCDRLNDDKRNKKFKFGGYNIVWSTDQFMDWLDSLQVGGQDTKYGEFLVSTAAPGAHGARVRAAIYTPDHEALEKYNSERIDILRDHVLAWYENSRKGKATKVTDSVAKTW